MSHLFQLLQDKFPGKVEADPKQLPTSIVACNVPRDCFALVGNEMKFATALLVAEWATDETAMSQGLGVYACYRLAGDCIIVKSSLPVDDPTFPTLTKSYPSASRFERQIHSLMGVVPLEHPDLRPWIAFEDWPAGTFPLRKTFDRHQTLNRGKGDYAWIRAEGEGVYEIPVGPVHAGIIEPGHFRFQAVGEDVIHLEARFGYVHKGIEKRFESLPWAEGYKLAGRVSGDTTVAHALGYCIALEALTQCQVPERAHWIRAILLERERIANHVGDLAAIANDAAFAFFWYQMMRLKEQFLRTNRLLFGHRFAMDFVIPGGVKTDLSPESCTTIASELAMFLPEFDRLVNILEENPSTEDRLRETGILSTELAKDLGVVGIIARASGIHHDSRSFHPFPPFDKPERVQLKVALHTRGDVHARVRIRILEVRESVRLILAMLQSLPSGAVTSTVGAPAPGTTGFSAVEGWRGEIIYWLQSGPLGEVNRCMVRDPSSLNWLGLERAVPGNIVPEFPLCNKSFNASYSGNDL